MDTRDYIEIIVSIINLLITGVIGYFAYRIGKRQNEINQRSLGLTDYADVFLMPQQLTIQNIDGKQQANGWNLLIKNASAFPVYLNKYILNGAIFNVGGSIIPMNSENWYQFPLTPDILEKKYFSVQIFFEDYTGRKYQTDGTGEINGLSWNVRTEKRKEI